MSLLRKSLSMSAPGKAVRTPRRRLKSTSILWADISTHPPAMQPVPLTPEEQEELRKKEERYNAKRRAKIEAAKAAIRAELPTSAAI